MGGGNPITKVATKIKKQIKRTKAEDALSFVGGPVNTLAGKAFTQATGMKADLLFNPVGTIAGEAGEKFIDKPKAAKEAAKKLEAESAAANKKAMADLEAQKKQSEAEAAASKSLARSRARQSRQSKGTGRRSTILTDKLGGAGGESGQRKSLLGL